VVVVDVEVVLSLRGTGTHPPLTQTPRNVVIDANGSDPTQVVGADGLDGCDGVVTGDELGGFNPGGNHPPFQHVPPPIAANGLGVEQLLLPAGGAPGAPDVAGGRGAVDGAVGVEGAVGPGEVGGDMPGGSHPPFQQVPPPIAANGLGVEQVSGGVTGVGGATTGIEIGGDGTGGFGDDPGGVIPGGSHPPFQHVPPPMFANGSAVGHPLGAVGVLGEVVGGGVLGDVGSLGVVGVLGEAVPVVRNTKSGETLSAPFQLTDRTR
jgi:hypothetical protein